MLSKSSSIHMRCGRYEPMNTPVELRRRNDVMLKSGSCNSHNHAPTLPCVTHYIQVQAKAESYKNTDSVQACNSDPGRTRLHSASSTNYSVPRTRTKYGDRAFSVAGPVVWNSLPAAVCEADSLYSFKRKLKTHFYPLFYWLTVCFMYITNFCNAFPVRCQVGRT